MTVVRFSRKGEDTLSYTLPTWATRSDKFTYLDICDIPNDPNPTRRFIVHLCGYEDPCALYALRMPDGKVRTRYVDAISLKTYRLRRLHGEDEPEVYSTDDIVIIGRVIEIWLTLDGKRRWLFCDEESKAEPTHLNRMATLLKQTVS